MCSGFLSDKLRSVHLNPKVSTPTSTTQIKWMEMDLNKEKVVLASIFVFIMNLELDYRNE